MIVPCTMPACQTAAGCVCERLHKSEAEARAAVIEECAVAAEALAARWLSEKAGLVRVDPGVLVAAILLEIRSLKVKA